MASALAKLAGWASGPSERNVLCLTGPGGQGKSALAWTYLTSETFVGAVRVWHGFSDDPDPAGALTATLARAARQAFGCEDDDATATALLQQRMATESGLIVLDAIEHLYGPSDRVLDAISSRFRTIADPRTEDLIRGLIALPKAKILITSRLAPAFIDDPVVCDQVQRLELGPIDAGASMPFWKSVKVRGSAGQLATATTALSGSPILMRLVARRVLSRHEGNIGAWLSKEQARISRSGDSDVLRRLIPEQSIGELADMPRKLLLLLAICRRRLSRTYWRDLAAGRVRPYGQNDREQEPSREEIDEFDEAVSDLLNNDLVHRDIAGDFDLHELLADAVIASAADDELDEAYRKLSDAQGPYLIVPEVGWRWDRLGSMADQATFTRHMGLFLTLLDRGALDSAAHILGTELYPVLRYRLGDLRQLRALVARYQVALSRHGSADGRSGYDVELALADGDWDEAIGLLGDGDRRNQGSSYLALRSEARSARGEFVEAYKDASAACFWAWRDSSLEEAADFYADLMDDTMQRMFWNVAPRCQGYHSAVAAQLALSRVLRMAGFRRTALLILTMSFPLAHSHPGELAAHWEECGALLAELRQPTLARQACDFARTLANNDGSQEQLLRVRALEMELRSGAGEQVNQSELTELLAEVTRLGFGALARRLLALHGERDGLSASIAWQYQAESLSAPPHPAPPAADDVLGEVAILAKIRIPGQWVELKLLETAVALAEEGKEISSDVILSEAWESVMDGPWARATRQWLDTWKPDPAASPHLAAVHRLDLLENDREAALALAATWTQSDPSQVFERLSHAVFYEPYYWRGEEVLEAMILAARACGRIPEAAWVLRYFIEEGWKVPESALTAAGLYREVGNYNEALYLSLAASEAANDRRPAGPGPAPDTIRIALILGAGLDLLALGTSPDSTVNAVHNGLCGFQMIGGTNPFSTGLREISIDRPEVPQVNELIGGVFGIAHRLDRGTAGHAALELFRKIAGSDGTLQDHEESELATHAVIRVDAEQDPHADATARAALAQVQGHDSLISRLDT